MQKPHEAVAIDGKRVCFVMPKKWRDVWLLVVEPPRIAIFFVMYFESNGYSNSFTVHPHTYIKTAYK